MKIFSSKALDSMALINRNNRHVGINMERLGVVEGKCKMPFPSGGEIIFNLTQNISQRLFLNKYLLNKRILNCVPSLEFIILSYLNPCSFNRNFLLSNALACINQAGTNSGLKCVTK